MTASSLRPTDRRSAGRPLARGIVRFDNATDQPATFIANYLMDRDDHTLIEMLP